MSSAFATSIAVSRAINYVRERRRRAPLLRSWSRRAYHSPGQEDLRVRHFLPGMGLALLVKRDNPYWHSERFALGQSAAAVLVTAALAARIARLGAEMEKD